MSPSWPVGHSGRATRVEAPVRPSTSERCLVHPVADVTIEPSVLLGISMAIVLGQLVIVCFLVSAHALIDAC